MNDPANPVPTGEAVAELLDEMEYETPIPFMKLDSYREHTQKFWNGNEIPRTVEEGAVKVETRRVKDNEGWSIVILEYAQTTKQYLVRQHADEVAKEISTVDRMEAPSL